MPIYIRFKNNRQIEATTLENKPEGEEWYEAPKDFNWEKSYCLTEGGKIAERSKEDIEGELLYNAKLCAFDNLRFYFNNFTHRFSGHSHQKAKSYQIQAKAAENILVAEEAKQQLNNKDVEIIEPLAKVREISVIEMAKLIQSKAEKAVKAMAKCEELEDIAKKKIKEIKSEKELYSFLDSLKQEIQNSLTNL